MAATGLVSGICGLATEILKTVNTKLSRKYVDKLFKLETELSKEESRGYDSDDGKIENLYEQIRLTVNALNNEIKLNNAKK